MKTSQNRQNKLSIPQRVGLGFVALGAIVTGACAPQQAETPNRGDEVVQLREGEPETERVQELSKLLDQSTTALESGSPLPDGVESAELGNGRTLPSGDSLGTKITTTDGRQVVLTSTPPGVKGVLSGSGQEDLSDTFVVSDPSAEPISQDGDNYVPGSRFTVTSGGSTYASGEHLIVQAPTAPAN